MYLPSEITNRWRGLSEGVWSRPPKGYLWASKVKSAAAHLNRCAADKIGAL